MRSCAWDHMCVDVASATKKFCSQIAKPVPQQFLIASLRFTTFSFTGTVEGKGTVVVEGRDTVAVVVVGMDVQTVAVTIGAVGHIRS